MTTEEFYALPRNERAVLVAKDIIAQVNNGKYYPKQGAYLNFTYITDWMGIKALKEAVDEGLDIKENFHLIPNGCAACAIGATILSCTHLGNKLKFSDIRASRLGIYDLDKASIKELLDSVFNPEQLLMIETAFEGWSYSADRYARTVLDVDLETSVYRACDLFYGKYCNDPEERMIAIYQNIIDNNGVFVP